MANPVVQADLTSFFLGENENASSLIEEENISLDLLPDYCAMAPSFGDDGIFVGFPLGQEDSMDGGISQAEERLQLLINQANELQTQIVCSQTSLQIIQKFLQTCEPFFTYLESTARNDKQPQPIYVRSQFLQISQKLCSHLAKLLWLFSSFGNGSLDESDPQNLSCFYIGQCHVSDMSVSTFYYCCPTPFYSTANTGHYKRMRWNVEQDSEGKGANTEFYFLCCTGVIEHASEEAKGRRDQEKFEGGSQLAWVWSIGKWVQTYPHPDSEDITDWVLCSVPCGEYEQLLSLGTEEPSTCSATDILLGVLLSKKA